METKLPRTTETFDPYWVAHLPDWQYHKMTDFLSSTGVKALLESPAYFHEQLIGAHHREETEALSLGRNIHAALLEPERYFSNRVVGPTKTRTAKKWREMQAELGPQAIMVTEDEERLVNGFLERLEKHSTAKGLLVGGMREVSGFAREPKYGFLCRIRLDLVHPELGLVADLKTTRNAKKVVFNKDLANMQYFVSAAFYLKIARLIEPNCFNQFAVVALQKDPIDVAVYYLDEAYLEIGEQYIDQALDVLNESVSKNEWPGIQRKGEYLGPPDWLMNQAALEADERQFG